MIVKMIVMIIIYIVFAPLVGAFIEGCGRKFTAALQGRRGPSVMQPLHDVRKLREKKDGDSGYIHNYYIKCYLFFIVVSGAAFAGGLDITFIILSILISHVFLIIGIYVDGSSSVIKRAGYEMMRMISFVPMLLFTAIGFQMYCGSMNVSDIVIGSSMPALPMIGVLAGLVAISSLRMKREKKSIAQFTGRTLSLIKIAGWYENVLMLGFIFLFFCNGSFIGYFIGVIASLLIYLFEIFLSNCFAQFRQKYIFGLAWITAAVLGITNVFMLYVII